jgi:hypothetical protein
MLGLWPPTAAALGRMRPLRGMAPLASACLLSVLFSFGPVRVVFLYFLCTIFSPFSAIISNHLPVSLPLPSLYSAGSFGRAAGGLDVSIASLPC